nr:immunoglobulin light chain junction region [Macaca mulatta]MOY07529.1 immunoglobulin light chain junction region [Macaca mulatta]
DYYCMIWHNNTWVF